MSKTIEVTATEFSNKRGELLEEARIGKDVIILRNKRVAAAMISSDRYHKLKSLEQIFDNYHIKSEPIKAHGFSQEESEVLTKKIMSVLNSEDK